MDLKFETINFEIIENIAIIRLNRPNSYNSLNAKMAKELLEISYECDTNKKIRAIILTGEGDKAFCAGGDLKSFHEAGNVANGYGSTTSIATGTHADIEQFGFMEVKDNSVMESGIVSSTALTAAMDVKINDVKISQLF